VKWFLITLAVLVAVVVIVIVVGALLPKAHRASRSAKIHTSPELVWATIAGYSKFPEWRKTVARVESLPPVDGKPSWREFDAHGGSIPFVIVESSAPQRMVTRIADPKLPFGGTWTYEISPAADGGSVIRITEDGEVYNPLFRFVSRFVMGYTATIDAYLRALGSKFGESITPED
jgi:uncharacterized protein YndB with AHSA1/START domain